MAINLSPALLVGVPVAPLIGAIVAGLFGKQVGRAGAHRITILGVAIAFFISAYVLYAVVAEGRASTRRSTNGWCSAARARQAA